MKDAKRKGRPVKKTGACHNCGKQGHWIADCPLRVQNDADRYRSQRANIAQIEDSGGYLFSVGGSSGSAKPNDVRVVDSGGDAAYDKLEEVHAELQDLLPDRCSSCGRRSSPSYWKREYCHVNKYFRGVVKTRYSHQRSKR